MTKLQILIIDDNADDRMLALRELKQEFANLQVTEVSNYRDFLQVLEKNYFNLVITDYRLCWTTGLEVLEAVKVKAPHCPVIMFTGTGSEEVAVKAMKAGLDDYVIKSPRHYTRLAKAVRAIWKREQQRRALQEAEQRYRRLFEGVPVGLYRLTSDGQILDANSMLLHILGYPNRQELGQSNPLERHLDEESRRVWQAQMETAGVVQDLETQLPRYDGTMIWVSHNARAVRDQQGQIIYYEGAMQDISDRRRAEQERAELLTRAQQACAEAETANRLKDEFLATLSHELRTPLNGILGWIQLLQKNQLIPEQRTRALKIIERSAKTQTQLVDDLLDISRIIRGRLQLQIMPVNPVDVVNSALDIVKPAAEAKSIKLERNYDSAVNLISGDPERLQQIVWNLLVNAIKFTPQGGSVTVRVEYNPNQVYIRVKDTGKGIEPKLLPHIFERFRQEDSSSKRAYGGLGLGLAIVRYLVELHGGEVAAHSSGIGHGSTFTVILPLLNANTSQSRPPQADAQKPDLLFPELNGLNILLVEDDPDAREIFTFTLQEYQTKVFAVGSVVEALAVYKQQPLDILISDISMPEQDGYDLIAQIRQQTAPLQPKLKAIAVTAYASQEDRRRALAAGFQEHLAKPVEPQQLIAAIARLVQ